MGTYSAFRTNGYPTIYGENKQPVTVDVLIAGLIFSFIIILVSFLLIVPGVRGKEKVPFFCRFAISLLIGAVILICNFGQEWEVGKVETSTQYKAFTEEEVEAEVELKIGLRSINITLVGKPIHQLGERIQYNERFSWEWAQGRNGFGPQAGRINREFRAAQWKGLPYPILWIAEYFTIDGEGIRFGRHYRTAGWYSHIMMWTAFPLWILSNILFFMVIRYGAYFLTLTGCCLILANILFASIRNFIRLEIPIGEEKLVLHYGWSFWLTLFTGLLCIVLGIAILILDLRNPDIISAFFGIDILQDYEDFYIAVDDLGIKRTEPKPESEETPNEEMYNMRKRSISIKFQQRPFQRPLPAPRHLIGEEEQPVYENLAAGTFNTIEEETEEHETVPLR
ncbi:dual oxidase maturation factor 1-like [Centruroides vittatus]|uniref:dual oxidase maturation factor 1-like n=1 Tax=Centruroides vittatus TaxID=120091 RepID=UPI00350EF57F